MTVRAKKTPAPKRERAVTPKPESLLAEEIRRPSSDVAEYIAWARRLVGAARHHRATLLATPMTPEADLTASELADFERSVIRLADIQDEQERRQEATANLTPTQQKNGSSAKAGALVS